MSQSSQQGRIEFQDKPVSPLFTYLLMLGMVACFAAAKANKAGIPMWLDVNAFALDRVHQMVAANNMQAVASMLLAANFASFHLLQLAFNVYFTFVFSKHVEQKLGQGRYLMILLMGLTVPWGLLYYLTRNDSGMCYVGPAFWLCAIIGAYLVVPPIPKSKLGQGTFKDRTQIFRKDPRPDPIEKYTANPWMFLLTFGVIQVLFHLWMTYGGTFWVLANWFPAQPGYDNLSILPCVLALALGYGITELMAQSATAHTKDSPLTAKALKTYYELLDLDVNHEEAIKGTARALGLPPDKVREWIAKNKGKLRVK